MILLVCYASVCHSMFSDEPLPVPSSRPKFRMTLATAKVDVARRGIGGLPGGLVQVHPVARAERHGGLLDVVDAGQVERPQLTRLDGNLHGSRQAVADQDFPCGDIAGRDEVNGLSQLNETCLHCASSDAYASHSHSRSHSSSRGTTGFSFA